MLNSGPVSMDLGEGMGPGANPGYKAVLAVPMATLIICPNCDTRYETKAVFPPEGRKVRCSKCSYVWQAQPVTVPEPRCRCPAAAAAAACSRGQAATAAALATARARGQYGDAGFAGIAAPAPRRDTPPPPAEADLAAQVAADQCRRHGRCAGGGPAGKAWRDIRPAVRPVACAAAAAAARCRHGRCPASPLRP